MNNDKKICLGAFAGAHGVRGDFKIKTFTENPRDVAAYGPLTSEDGKQTFSIKIKKVMGPNFVLAHAPEVATREDATALSSTRLYVDRDRLPPADEDEFYLEDLVGLKVINSSGENSGKIVGVHNFGAGDMVELKHVPNRKGSIMIAFTLENFPDIDLAGNCITVLSEALIEITTPDDKTRRG